MSSDVRRRTGLQTNSQSEFELPELAGKASLSLPRRSLTSPSLSHTHTSKSTIPNPFPRLHPGLGIRFQLKSKQVTSLEVITQVAYLAG